MYTNIVCLTMQPYRFAGFAELSKVGSAPQWIVIRVQTESPVSEDELFTLKPQ